MESLTPVVSPKQCRKLQQSRRERKTSSNRQINVNIVSRFYLEYRTFKSFLFGPSKIVVADIAPSYDGHAWVLNYGIKEIARVSKQGRFNLSASVFTNVSHVCEDANKSLIITSDQDHFVWRIRQTGVKEALYKAFPSFTRGVCLGDANLLYVACFSPKLSKIVVISTDTKEEVRQFETSDVGKPFFQSPYHVLKNINGDICVTDINKCQLVSIKDDNSVRFVYRGVRLPDTMCPFVPYGLAKTSVGQLVVSDHNNHCVHILDADGNFVNFLLTHVYKIQYPVAIAVDNEDYAWVACRDGYITVCQF